MAYDALIGSLKNCCLEWQNKNPDQETVEVTASFIFDKEFDGFKGHFPGMPVLPAIAQLAMVRIAVQFGLGCILKPIGYSNTKFKGVIQPEEKLLVKVTCKTADEKSSGSFTIEKDGQTVVTSGNFEFVQREEG